jgi:hypothetical protein
MLKLAKLPDRTPVKISIGVSPDLNQALADYAALYEQIYNRPELVGDLIPAMLTSFLESDRAFQRYRQIKKD